MEEDFANQEAQARLSTPTGSGNPLYFVKCKHRKVNVEVTFVASCAEKLTKRLNTISHIRCA